MNTFVNAVKNQKTVTSNGMKARKSTADACVDLFFKIGASRGQNIVPQFVAAYAENRDLALRIAAWVRDVRGGAGEREIYRDILRYLEVNDVEAAKALVSKAPELGRWDDVLSFNRDEKLKNFAFQMIADALASGNGLCAKWMPRKGKIAVELRNYLGWTPKFYRKTLVNLTKVVESQMCANDWDNINFSHVPSVASARYKKAFGRHTEKYAEYVQALVKGEDGVKVNASAIFPHDVLKGRISYFCVPVWNKTELDLIEKQWEALPNYVGAANILPLVDVSGSMSCTAGKGPTTCLEIAVSLGLYLADKNKGKFKDTFLTFSSSPELLHLKGNINQKIDQMVKSRWAMSTNIEAAFQKILNVAKNGKVPQSEMPEAVLILSDMQFDACVHENVSAMKMIKEQYKNAGYEVPKVVFWNLDSYDNVPVIASKSGAALVSGFSPAILKAVLANDLEDFTPLSVMMKTIMDDRYKVV